MITHDGPRYPIDHVACARPARVSIGRRGNPKTDNPLCRL